MSIETAPTRRCCEAVSERTAVKHSHDCRTPYRPQDRGLTGPTAAPSQGVADRSKRGSGLSRRDKASGTQLRIRAVQYVPHTQLELRAADPEAATHMKQPV